FALLSGGTMAAWGSNANGRLGNGTTDYGATPVQVSGLTGVSAIAAGKYNGYALRSDGTLWGWGKAINVGNGTTSDSSVPVLIAGLADVKAVSGAVEVVSALLADGTVRVWGNGSAGQFGRGLSAASYVPAQVNALAGATAVASGYLSQYALATPVPMTAAGAVPLLAAHGITGSAQDMDGNLDLAQQLVPSLEAVQSVDTGPISSVWVNGTKIVEEAAALAGETGHSRVNVIAHSKGGLDTRVAMWQRPELFRALGMLATPNGGSVGADNLCKFRRLGLSGIVANQGPCDDAGDGLFNLQTGYVQDVFNTTVRDWPQHVKYVTAGDCSGIPLDPGCLALTQTLATCELAGLEGAAEGNDGVVCVSSAFRRSWMVTGLVSQKTGGTDFPLLPVFRLGHSAMKANECPTSQVLDELYGQRNVDNPYSEGTLCAAANPEPSPTPGPDPEPTDGRSAATSSSVAAQGLGEGVVPSGNVDESPAAIALTPQRVEGLKLQAGVAGRLEVDPEGTGPARVELWSDGALIVDVSTTEGTADASTVATGEADGATVTAVTLPGGDGAARVLHVTSEDDTTIGVVTFVAAGQVSVDATITPTGPDQGTLTVTTSGIGAQALADSTVRARVGATEGLVDVALQSTGTVGSYQATIPLTAGGWTPVDVTLDGPVSREVTVGTVTTDGSAQILGATGDRLVDADGDGAADALEVDVAVRVSVPGGYELAADFVTRDGVVAFSAPGVTDLDAGEGAVTLRAPVAALIAGGWDGPYELMNGILIRTTEDRPWVATADAFGTVGAHPIASLPVDQLGLYSPTLGLDDATTTLRLTARAAIVDAGTYRLSGSLTGSGGERVGEASIDVELGAGLTPVGLSLDAAGLPAGTYTVSDLTIADVADPVDEAIAVPARVDLVADSEPEPAVPTLRSTASLTLTNQFQTTGTDGDVVTAGNFTCNSSVHIGGDVTAAGNVRMTNSCRIDGDVYAGGSVSLSSTAAIGGDALAVGDVATQSTATIGGSITTGGAVRSIDGRSVEELQAMGAVGGEVREGQGVTAPTIPAAVSVSEPSGELPGFATTTWARWMNQVAAANFAPSWSQGRRVQPGCVMAPWASSVNGDSARIDAPTVIDARSTVSGCSAGITVQGMTLKLGADAVLYADRLSVISGLKVESLDGEYHELRVLIPSTTPGCDLPPKVVVTNGMSSDQQISVQIMSAGRVQMNGPVAMNARLDVGCLASSGAVVLNPSVVAPMSND
ncbi:MAG: hypothetical protein HGA44_08920, partial [Cellulomonadaceae bacterium]|nr:hypothetical protein [Cellulomonadaceae bacterium]